MRNGPLGDPLLLVDVVHVHEHGRIADVPVCLLVLLHQDFEDARVAPNRRIGALGHQVDDPRRGGLAVAIHPAVSLLEDHQRPGQVEVNQAVALVMQVDALGGDIRADQEPHRALSVPEVLHDTLLFDVAHAAVEGLHLTGLEREIRGELRLQPVQGRNAFGEDDETVGRVVGFPDERLVVANRGEQRLVLGVGRGDDPFERGPELMQAGDFRLPGRAVLAVGDLPLSSLDTVRRGLEAGRGAREEGLLQGHREEVAARGVSPAAGDGDGQQRLIRRLFLHRRGESRREHLPVLERLTHLLLHVLLEAADHEPGAEVCLRVLVGVGDRGGIQHVDQAGEAARLAVVRGGREHDEGVGLPRQQLREAAPQGARTPVGHVVRLVDDDDVPPRLFQIRTVFRVLFEGVDGDDRLVVVVERVVVGRNAAPHPLNADRIQAGEGNREAVPEFLLELGQHALHREHENALAAPPSDELAHQDPGFQGLAKADCIGDQDALAGPRKREARRVELIGNEIHGGRVPNVNVRVVRHGLTKLALHVEDAVGELGGLVGNELRLRRVEHLDGGLQGGEKEGLAPPYELGDPIAHDLISAGRVVHAPDNPLRIAHDDARTGGRDEGLSVGRWFHGDRQSLR